MSFLDRLREFVYVSPSGKEFRPSWEIVERGFQKKVSVHEIVGSNKASVQDLGNGNVDYPNPLYFYGPDYDKTADAFYEALKEAGPAKIKHPRWGDLRVIPTAPRQKESFVEGMRCSVFDIKFIDAPDLSVTAKKDTAAAIQSASDVAADSIGAPSAYTDKVAKARGKAKVLGNIKNFTNKVKSISTTLDSVREEISTTARQIESTIDDLMGSPLAVIQSFTQLARLPARIEADIRAKVTGYAELIDDAIDALLGDDSVDATTIALTTAQVFALSIAGAEATTAGTLENRDDAIDSRNALDDALSQALALVDAMQAKGYTPDPALLAMIADLRARVSNYLLGASYSLPSQKRITLDAATILPSLSYRLLDDADRYTDLIKWNGWGGDLLLVIPAGTVVRYYE